MRHDLVAIPPEERQMSLIVNNRTLSWRREGGVDVNQRQVWLTFHLFSESVIQALHLWEHSRLCSDLESFPFITHLPQKKETMSVIVNNRTHQVVRSLIFKWKNRLLRGAVNKAILPPEENSVWFRNITLKEEKVASAILLISLPSWHSQRI